MGSISDPALLRRLSIYREDSSWCSEMDSEYDGLDLQDSAVETTFVQFGIRCRLMRWSWTPSAWRITATLKDRNRPGADQSRYPSTGPTFSNPSKIKNGVFDLCKTLTWMKTRKVLDYPEYTVLRLRQNLSTMNVRSLHMALYTSRGKRMAMSTSIIYTSSTGIRV